MSAERTAASRKRGATASEPVAQGVAGPVPENTLARMLRELDVVGCRLEPSEARELGVLHAAAMVGYLRENPALLGQGALCHAARQAIAAGPSFAESYFAFLETYLHIGARSAVFNLSTIATSLIEHDQKVQAEHRRQGRL